MTDTEMQHELEKIRRTNDGKGYVSFCVCAWASKPVDTEEEALEEHEVHLRDPNRDEA